MEAPFPPFEPEEEEGKKTRLRDIPFRTLIPNIITLLAICAGLTGIRLAIEGKLEFSIAAILLAAFLDGIDGRVARFLNATSRFGEQMDSLADFVNFGVAPPLILYFVFLQFAKPFGWIAALIFAMCASLRLARFNVQIDMPNRPSWKNDYFVGVPAPAGAMIVLLPAYLHLLGLPEMTFFPWAVAIYVVICGILLVSNIPTFSGKNIGEHIPRAVAMPILLSMVVLIALLVTFPWEILIFASVGYLVSLMFSYSSYEKRLMEEASQPKKRTPRKKRGTLKKTDI